MKKSLIQFEKESLYSLLLTLLIGFGIAGPLHLLLGLTPRPWLILAICLAGSALFFLSDCIRPLRFVLYPLIPVICFVLLIWPYREQAGAFFNAFVLAVNHDALSLSVWSYPLTLLLAVLAVSFAHSVSRGETAILFSCALLILLFIPIAIGKAGVSAFWLLPMAAAFLLSLRETSTRFLTSIVSAVLTLVLALAVLPSIPLYQKDLGKTAQTVRRLIDDYLFFTDARTPFSLTSTGWQPLGANRLGGPADPSNDKVMQVLVSGPTLLRGTIRNEYNGFAWSDNIGGRRYLFVDPRFASMRRNLFDQARPETRLRNRFPSPELIRVYIESSASSTLYMTQRFESFSGQEIVPYFSPDSELFTTHTLDAGSQYDFSGIRVTAETEGIRDLVLSAAATSDAWLEEQIKPNYLALPDSVEADVYTLAAQITQNARTDFDRALALSTYLSTSFPYTLNQDIPPTTRDFVSWFLFEEKKGYCTSFASSLAVMARAIGLPSRYIEGYSVRPGEDGIARVTQKNAHAWCEIYFAGFGWLPFDPTPSDGSAGSSPDRNDGDWSSDAPTPTPSPAPTPSPTPTPEAPSTPTPSPTPEEDSSEASTPTPAPTPTPTPSPDGTPETTPPPDDESPKHPPLFLILFLLILLLVLCIVLRLYLSAPDRVARKQKGRSSSFLIWYAAILQALRAMGISPQPGEAPASFLRRAEGLLGGKLSLSDLTEAVCTVGYSSRKPGQRQITRARTVYRHILKQMKASQKLRLYTERLRHGLSLRQIESTGNFGATL